MFINCDKFFALPWVYISHLLACAPFICHALAINLALMSASAQCLLMQLSFPRQMPHFIIYLSNIHYI